MLLLWTLVTVSAVMITLAGAQAVWLLRNSDANVVRLTLQLDTLQDDVSRAQQQIEAQRFLILQAEAWMKARQAVAP